MYETIVRGSVDHSISLPCFLFEAGEWREFPIRPFTWKTQENLLVEFSDLNKPNHSNEGSALQVT